MHPFPPFRRIAAIQSVYTAQQDKVHMHNTRRPRVSIISSSLSKENNPAIQLLLQFFKRYFIQEMFSYNDTVLNQIDNKFCVVTVIALKLRFSVDNSNKTATILKVACRESLFRQQLRMMSLLIQQLAYILTLTLSRVKGILNSLQHCHIHMYFCLWMIRSMITFIYCQ